MMASGAPSISNGEVNYSVVYLSHSALLAYCSERKEKKGDLFISKYATKEKEANGNVKTDC